MRQVSGCLCSRLHVTIHMCLLLLEVADRQRALDSPGFSYATTLLYCDDLMI